MKNRKRLLISLWYIILYHIVFELINFLRGINDKEWVFTPIGRIIRILFSNQNSDFFKIQDILITSYNLVICTIFFTISFRWLLLFNTLQTLIKLVVAFICLSFITWLIISWNGIGLATIGGFIFFYIFPIGIMVILTIPFLWFINEYTNLNLKKT